MERSQEREASRNLNRASKKNGKRDKKFHDIAGYSVWITYNIHTSRSISHIF
jgi:hypothetical protein